MSDLQKRSGINVFIFGVMLLVVFTGKPYLPDANSVSLNEPPMQAGLWDQIDQARFPQKDLQTLCSIEAEEVYHSNGSFTTIGVAKRLESLNTHGSFALMTTVMFCCVADAFAVGLRVPDEDWENIQDGQWLMVSGKLVKEKTEITLPNFRFGRAMLSTVHKTYHLQPERIMSYDRVAQLPLITDQIINGQSSQLFGKALKESGIWQDLEKEGPFTVFLPVDKAVEDLLDEPFDGLSKTDLRQFVSSHIIKGKFFERGLMDQETLETLNGQILQVEFMNGKVRINQSRLLLKNTEARNGVIHFIYTAISSDE